MKNLLRFHDGEMVVQAIENCGIPFHPGIQGAHPSVLQKILRRVNVGLKSKSKLQNGISGRIP
jgi:hypothetical protein